MTLEECYIVRVDTAEIECFLTVAGELHFARAAERLGLTPSRVSRATGPRVRTQPRPTAARPRPQGRRAHARRNPPPRTARPTRDLPTRGAATHPAQHPHRAALERTRKKRSVTPGTIAVGKQ